MGKIQKFAIFLTLVLLCSSFFFETRTETIIAFALILSLGILHGANDIQIIKKVQSNSSSFFKLLTIYLLAVLGVGLLFFILPMLGLFLFLLVSAYHFGEQHFHNIQRKYPKLNYVFFSSYGLSIIFLLLFCHADAAAKVIIDIAGISVSKTQFLIVLSICSVLTVLTGSYLVVKGVIKAWIKELVYIFLFFLIFENTSLILGFAIYFVIWHSLPSLLDQVRFLTGGISFQGVWQYVKSSALYWIMSIVGLGVFVYFMKNNEELFLSLFFTFLAAITFPHVFVMHKLFSDHQVDH